MTNFIIFFSCLLVVSVAMTILACRSIRKNVLKNTFYQKDDLSKRVLFKRFVTGIFGDFETDVFVEFFRFDNKETYVMRHRDFINKFIIYNDLKNNKIEVEDADNI